ncbi:hypothetical protein [Streptomyces sp. NRRL S-87]|uniref:hypothetical protein n=1 Tax=Streptomyces sp. NRRL S-87 TaxID=1463920 RepID=UPI0004C26065|nr:hypothetical protein [Streptomyces sp. NRRL S-87]
MRVFGEVAGWISALTGLIGLVLGFFGLPAVVASPTAERVAATVTVTATTTVTATVTAPAGGAGGASGSGGSDGGSGSPSPSAGGAPSDVYRTATVDVAEDYGFSLDDDPLRPVKKNGKQRELYRWSAALWVDDESQLVVLGRNESGSHATCSTVTRFQDKVEVSDMKPGFRFCVLSKTGLVGLVEFKGGGLQEGYVRLKLTIWKGTY